MKPITPHHDLARAIAQAPPHAVLLLAEGTHRVTGPLVVRRPLALLGLGDARIVLDHLDARLTGRLALRDLFFDGGGLRIGGDTEVEVVDCRVKNAPGAGVAFDGTAHGHLRGCLVERCGVGIRVAGRAAPDLEANILLDNADAGLAYEGEAGGEAHGNLCQGTWWACAWPGVPRRYWCTTRRT